MLLYMSNISKADYTFLRTLPADWSLFEHVFASGDVGMRKSALCFYEHDFRAIGSRPEKVIFVDDGLENAMSAQSLGMEGIQFQDPESLAQILGNLLGDPVRRGENLNENAKMLHSATENGTNYPILE